MKRTAQELQHRASTPRKKRKISVAKPTQVRHSPVLDSCYSSVLTVRQYLDASLPAKSSRRKQLNALHGDEVDAILDVWEVGLLTSPTPDVQRARSLDLAAFTQTQRSADSYTGRTLTCTLDEVLDFTIWHLFNKVNRKVARPRHLLCNGFQRGVAPDGSAVVPGIAQVHPNDNLNLFRSSAWRGIFVVLGSEADSILTGLLLDCGIFLRLKSGSDNHYQVSGVPIADLKSEKSTSTTQQDVSRQARPPSTINFVRSRILYAKPSLNKQGKVRFGLKHIHVLQRCSNLTDGTETIHVIKHVFPRQFRLHNVFTSEVDKRLTSQPFLDYLYREEEIQATAKHPKTWLPPRLRGPVLKLVQKMRKLHSRCQYGQLLRHYVGLSTSPTMEHLTQHGQFPTPSSGFVTQCALSTLQGAPAAQSAPDPAHSFLEHSASTPRVSAFSRAVLRSVLPKNAFGEGPAGHSNWSIILNHVDQFVRGRRFETISLDQVCQGLQLNCITWLVPEKMQKGQKMSKQERKKRLELFREFVYYVFDSLLIPLIQSNFYVTESGPQRNRLFYFRHDVWRKLTEPITAMVRSGSYQQLSSAEVRHLFNARTMGYSHVRLLPKDEGARTITNLRRRMTKTINGKRVLGPSINSQLAPIFSALSFERRRNPGRLGGAIFSVGGLRDKLKDFKALVDPSAKLYFAKVDVQSCFDSIPQVQLLAMIEAVFQRSPYRTTKYVEAKPAGATQIRQRFLNLARTADQQPVFSEGVASEMVADKGGRVLAEVGTQKVWQHQQLVALLRDHVQNNIVKIGKKHYRQTEGIAQGSVLSSLLCSFFYSAFEHDQLSFLDSQNAVLVRLIDDFLLVTTDKRAARTFLQVMTQSHPRYGITVNPQKSLANFEVAIGIQKIPRHQSTDFPYCGLTIDVATLEVGRDRQRKDPILSNGLTVDLTKKAGSTFVRKVRLSFTQQMSKMLVDDTLNSPERILKTLTEAFSETIMKMHVYLRGMSRRQRPHERLLMQLVDELLQLGLQCVCRSSRMDSGIILSKQQVVLALTSGIESVLGVKQSNYRRLLHYVGTLKEENRPGQARSRRRPIQLSQRGARR